MDHCQRDGKGPAIELAVKNVFVVNNDSEGEEDPDCYIGIGKDDLLHYSVRQGSAFPHFLMVAVVVKGGRRAGV